MSEIPATSPAQTSKRFAVMTAGEKLVFIGKSIVFVLTSGFLFPRIWSD